MEGESEEDVKLENKGEESSQKEKWALVAHRGGKKRRIRKWQKESERQKWYHMYITLTRGCWDDSCWLQALFIPLNRVILYDQVMIGHVKLG